VEDAKHTRAVRAHIRYLRVRSKPDADQFAGMMLRWVWPGGHDDRFDPVAVEWLRRWTPETIGTAPAECGCTAGRCTVCN
jgi:hypothetical protein